MIPQDSYLGKCDIQQIQDIIDIRIELPGLSDDNIRFTVQERALDLEILKDDHIPLRFQSSKKNRKYPFPFKVHNEGHSHTMKDGVLHISLKAYE